MAGFHGDYFVQLAAEAAGAVMIVQGVMVAGKVLGRHARFR
jgi:hypothetical protein